MSPMQKNINALSTITLLAAIYLSANTGLAQEQQEEPTLTTATFAGGCFWCMEPPFDKLDGVESTVSGYTGGDVEHPTYEQVSSGTTGHYEAVQVSYDPNIISYSKLLDVYWRNIDPYDEGGQFCDRGEQYKSAIFYEDSKQRQIAEQSKQQLIEKEILRDNVATEVEMAHAFYPAEQEHQNYYQEHPIKYRFYRFTCGRDVRLAEVWKDEL